MPSLLKEDKVHTTVQVFVRGARQSQNYERILGNALKRHMGSLGLNGYVTAFYYTKTKYRYDVTLQLSPSTMGSDLQRFYSSLNTFLKDYKHTP